MFSGVVRDRTLLRLFCVQILLTALSVPAAKIGVVKASVSVARVNNHKLSYKLIALSEKFE